jgi:hypothetical protein
VIRVVNVRKAPFTLYIGRAFGEFLDSKWRNPFHVKTYGREKCLEMFEIYARANLWGDLHELDNQTLGCWCHPKTCHGEVLKRLREEQLNALRGTTIPD